jgi:hypothetical protein
MTKEEIIIRHEMDDETDRRFAEDAACHPECCATDADYPTWTPAQGCRKVAGA